MQGTTTQISAGSWGSDDTIVFSDDTVGALMRVAASGGNPERLSVRGEPVPMWPHLLPDRRHLLLSSGSGIQRAALDSEALTLVSDVRSMAVYVPSGHLLYARDGSLFDLVTGTPTKLSDDLFLDNWPTWWPDGRSIVVSRDTSSSEPHLYRRSIAGASEPVRLVPPRTPSGLQSEPDVLFDGQAVAFAERGDIWLWRLGAPDFEPLVQSQYSESSPAFSPDGRWVAYDSNSSGRREVYVLPFGRPGEPVRISDAGGFAPRWREDGRELFFLDPARQIMAVALATDKTPSRPPVRLTNGRRIEGFDVTPDGTRFVAVVSLPNPSPPSLTVVMNWPTLMK